MGESTIKFIPPCISLVDVGKYSSPMEHMMYPHFVFGICVSSSSATGVFSNQNLKSSTPKEAPQQPQTVFFAWEDFPSLPNTF